jgi:hypothetical protein
MGLVAVAVSSGRNGPSGCDPQTKPHTWQHWTDWNGWLDDLVDKRTRPRTRRTVRMRHNGLLIRRFWVRIPGGAPTDRGGTKALLRLWRGAPVRDEMGVCRSDQRRGLLVLLVSTKLRLTLGACRHPGLLLRARVSASQLATRSPGAAHPLRIFGPMPCSDCCGDRSDRLDSRAGIPHDSRLGNCGGGLQGQVLRTVCGRP